MDYGYFYHLFHFKILYTKQNKYLTKKPVGIHSSGRLIQIINLAFNIVCTLTWQWLLKKTNRELKRPVQILPRTLNQLRKYLHLTSPD